MKKYALFFMLIFCSMVSSAKRNGYQTYFFPDGSKFEGCWKNDVINGTGIYYWTDTHYYVGHWINGKRWGYGLEVFPNGQYQLRYFENEQNVKRSIPNTQTLNTCVGIYQGEIVNGKACGKGTFRWNNGQWFEGTWTADGKSRYGVLYHSNSQKPYYIGNWTNEKFDGYGCIISESGQITIGLWRNGEYLYRSRF